MDLACKCDGHNFIDMKMASYAYDTILQEQMRIKWLGGVATGWFKVGVLEQKMCAQNGFYW